MPIIGAKGSPSSGGFGQFAQASAVPNYIEDVFSTWLYTGNGSTQTITNGIDLAGEGGMVWVKNRQTTIGVPMGHILTDTARGVTKFLRSQSTSAQETSASSITAFNSNGFSFGSDTNINYSGDTYVSWTFREQPKFFDVVTYTGNGVAGLEISHSLASTPGFIVVKQTSASGQNWRIWHRSVNGGNAFAAFTTEAFDTTQARFIWGNNTTYIAPTSTTFTVSNDSSVNANGATYVAYLFAHNAGGFGLSGTDNVISCGSFTGAATVTLGYEPQWVLYKRSDDASDWVLTDNMRGMYASFAGANGPVLEPNTSDAEAAGSRAPFVNATGFYFDGVNNGPGSSGTYIYIAIRRGPMRTPTTGTSVFAPVTQTAAGTVTTGFPVDLAISGSRTITGSKLSLDRLRGSSTNSYASLFTNSNGVEGTGTGSGFGFDNNTGYVDAFWSTSSMAYWNFRRAPGFFDEVCYTGTGVARTVAHNLTVPPELMVIKVRTPGGYAWRVYAAPLGITQSLVLNTTAASVTDTYWNGTAPTSTVFSVNDYGQVNNSGSPIVAYLFATCPGVSKVGSYTGTGTTQTINCGFTAGSRFVMIKRTDSTGDWVLWDSSRGMVAGTDPRLALNSTAAEVNQNWVYTTTGGFQIVTSDATVNASGGSYIYLSIA